MSFYNLMKKCYGWYVVGMIILYVNFLFNHYQYNILNGIFWGASVIGLSFALYMEYHDYEDNSPLTYFEWAWIGWLSALLVLDSYMLVKYVIHIFS